MRYLGLALFSEGPSDHRFLRPLLRRVCERRCLLEGQPVEIGEVLELHGPRGWRDAPRDVRVAESARRAVGGWHVLFVHTDGGGDPAGAEAERIKPAVDRLRDDLDDEHRCVAVVPFRETEAWILADPESLRYVLGGIPPRPEDDLPEKPARVEKIPDPKKVLAGVHRRVARRGNAGKYFQPLGERISLDRLDAVPSFQAFDRSLSVALRELRYLA